MQFASSGILPTKRRRTDRILASRRHIRMPHRGLVAIHTPGSEGQERSKQALVTCCLMEIALVTVQRTPLCGALEATVEEVADPE